MTAPISPIDSASPDSKNESKNKYNIAISTVVFAAITIVVGLVLLKLKQPANNYTNPFSSQKQSYQNPFSQPTSSYQNPFSQNPESNNSYQNPFSQ